MPELDALEALRNENPRNDPTFKAAVATMTRHTEELLAAAAVGTSVGAATLPRGRFLGAGPNHRARWLWGLLISMGAVAIVLLLVITNQPSSSSSTHSQSVPPGTKGVATTSPSHTPGSTGPGPSTTVTTVTTVPATVSSVAPAAPVGPNASGSTVHGAGRPVHTTTPPKAPPTTAASTAPTSPPTVEPSSSPTCAVAALVLGPPAHQSVTVEDTGSGLASITNVAISNGTVSIPAFARGTKGPVVVVATKIDQALPTHWSFDATDVAGHTTFCN